MGSISRPSGAMPVIASTAVSNTEHLSQLESLGARHTPEEDQEEQPVDSLLVRDTVLDGRYRLCDEIGRGGMGSVWRAERLGWQAHVAVKLMTRTGPSKPGARHRFEREVRLAARVRSPHVVQVLDHGVHAPTGTPFLVMELLEGESLAARLRRTSRLSAQLTFQLVIEVGRALNRAHDQGIIHRDLKPDNLFLVPNGDDILVKVLDFGVAKWIGPNELDSFETRPGSVVGSPLYMSPEQLRADATIDARTDLWSLAVIVCECLTGVRPFDAPDFASLAVLLCGDRKRGKASELGPVPRGFDRWFACATHTIADKRFQTIADFTDSLRKVCQRANEEANATLAQAGNSPTPRAWMHAASKADSLAPTLSDSRLVHRLARRSTRSRLALGLAMGLSFTLAAGWTMDRLGSGESDVNRGSTRPGATSSQVSAAIGNAPASPQFPLAAEALNSARAPKQTPASTTVEATEPVASGKTTLGDDLDAPTPEPSRAALAPHPGADPAVAAPDPPLSTTRSTAQDSPRSKKRPTRSKKRRTNSRRASPPAKQSHAVSPDSQSAPSNKPVDAAMVNGHRIRTLLSPTSP